MTEPEFDYLGPYRVEKTLGRGGMGTVYKGVHAKSGEVDAIKVIATGVANQARFRRRFEAEIHTLQKLKHPNIVTLKGVGEEQGLLFYTMEYVDGFSLHEHLRKHKTLPWEDVVEIGIQTTAALKHAHDLGIIHRDLKPANLMVNGDGQIKLTDFGIARLFGAADLTAPGSVIGTADYMPPEQAEGKAVTVKSDLYGLGGVLYALLSGKPPFTGKSVPEVLYSVRYNPVPGLESRAPDAPAELCELIHHMLEKSPSRRPPTALVVGNRLKSLQQGMKRSTKEGQPEEPEEQAPKIGTQLTSLDLSDVDDEELRVTNDAAAANEKTGKSEVFKSSTNIQNSGDPHEERTLLAPNEPSREEGDEAPTAFATPEDLQEAQLRSAHDASEPTPSEIGPLSSGGPSHYTPVSEVSNAPFELERSNADEPTESAWLQYLSIGGIVALLIGSIAFGWVMLQPRDADDIYETIMFAVDSGEDEQILASKGDIEEFLNRFPDDERSQDIQSLSDELELTRWTRVLKRRASREGGQNELTAIEQAFLDCMQARGQDFQEASRKLEAFLKVFGPLEDLSRNEQRLVELAQFASEMGQSLDRKESVAASQLVTLVRSAEASLKGAKLKQYYRDILLLYSDKPWAREQIARIEAKLDADIGP